MKKFFASKPLQPVWSRWTLLPTFFSFNFAETPSRLRSSTLHKCQTKSQINAFHSVAQGNVQTEHFFMAELWECKRRVTGYIFTLLISPELLLFWQTHLSLNGGSGQGWYQKGQTSKCLMCWRPVCFLHISVLHTLFSYNTNVPLLWLTKLFMMNSEYVRVTWFWLSNI